jgi:hypothetical protein
MLPFLFKNLLAEALLNLFSAKESSSKVPRSEEGSSRSAVFDYCDLNDHHNN